MERRVAGRVLGFLIGSAGVVLAVFVVLPWLETPDESVDRREPLGAIVEVDVAAFGHENAAEEGDTGIGTVEESAVIAAPSAIQPMGAEGPQFGPEMEPGSEAGTAQVEIDAFQSADDDSETRPLEEGAVVTSDVESAGTEPEVEWEDGPPGVKTVSESVLAATDAVEALEPLAVETMLSGKAIAPVSLPAQDVGIPAAVGLVPGAESLPDMKPVTRNGFPQMKTARHLSRSGLPRLEFETPEAVQLGGTPLRTEGSPPLSFPTAFAEPLSEFSPRSFSGPTKRPAGDVADAFVGRAETLDRHEAQSGTPQAYQAAVPSTLRDVMGYRLPLISRQELPDQVVSGVLIPAHTTYVILQPGYWEQVGLSPDDVVAIRAAAERSRADEQAAPARPAGRGWKPFRLFKKRRAPAAGN